MNLLNDIVCRPGLTAGYITRSLFLFLFPTFYERVYRLSPSAGKRAGKVGDVVFGRAHDAILLVDVDHGRLNAAWASIDWSCYQQHTQPTDQAVGAYALAYSIIVI